MKRRRFLELSTAGIAAAALPLRAQEIMPAHDLQPLIREITGASAVQPGRITLEMPQLAENGNSVHLRLTVDSPMTEADHVLAVHVFAERNPRPHVASFFFGSTAGRAQLTTRVRLAATQRVLAIAAMSDGSFWSAQKDVVVTTGACLDEMSL